MRRFSAALLTALSSLAVAAYGAVANYYISAHGDDSADGTTVATAWRTIARVNQQAIAPGDSILFEGGGTYSGSLSFEPGRGGSAEAPISITSFGVDRATISGGTETGLYIHNVSGFKIKNINFIGAGMAAGKNDAIMCYNDLSAVKLPYLHIDQVGISDFGGHGFIFGGDNGSGFTDVSIADCVIERTRCGGVKSWGQALYAHHKVRVAGVTVRETPGDPESQFGSGSGILLSSVDGGVIERCFVRDTGADNRSEQGGPCGLWTYESRAMTIQYNEVCFSHTMNHDGAGLDFDGGVTDSLMQYNYTHDNHGAGILLCSFKGQQQEHARNVIRYNICENDSRSGKGGALTIFSNIYDDEIYGNVFWIQTENPDSTRLAMLWEWQGRGLHFRNNIFAGTRGSTMVELGGTSTGSDLVFQGNAYWQGSGALQFTIEGNKYSSLVEWRQAGHESLDRKPVGTDADPGLSSPGRVGTVNDPDLLVDRLRGYKPTATSALIGHGVDLIALGLDPGPRDFFGNPLAKRTFDIGAFQSNGSKK